MGWAIDSTGREVIAVNPCWKPILDSDFHEGYALVKSCIWGRGLVVINKQGQKILVPGYNNLKPLSAGLMAAEGEDGWGFINLKGEVVIPHQYNRVSYRFEQGLSVVFKSGMGEGVIDTTGKEILPTKYGSVVILGELKKYDNVGGSYDLLISAKTNEKEGLYDRYGAEVIPPKYQRVSLFHEGLAVVENEGKLGVININNEIVIPLMYDAMQENKLEYVYHPFFSEGLLAVRKNISRSRKPHKAVYKWGFINKKNEVVIPFVFEDVSSFDDGEAQAKYEGKWGIIAHPFYTEWKKEQENKEEEAEAESGGK